MDGYGIFLLSFCGLAFFPFLLRLHLRLLVRYSWLRSFSLCLFLYLLVVCWGNIPFLWLVWRLSFSLFYGYCLFRSIFTLHFFQDLYCWVNFFRGDPVPASAPLWAGCWVSSPPVIIVWSVVALVSGWWVFLIDVPVTLSKEVAASVSVPYFLVVMVAAVVASVVLVVWIRSWAGLGSFLLVWVVGSFLMVIVAGVVTSVVLVVWIGSWAGLGPFLVVWVVVSFRCSIFWCWEYLLGLVPNLSLLCLFSFSGDLDLGLVSGFDGRGRQLLLGLVVRLLSLSSSWWLLLYLFSGFLVGFLGSLWLSSSLTGLFLLAWLGWWGDGVGMSIGPWSWRYLHLVPNL